MTQETKTGKQEVYKGNLRYGFYTLKKPMPNIVGRYLYFKPNKGWEDISYLTPNKLYKITKQEGSLNDLISIQADRDIGEAVILLDKSRSGHIKEVVGSKWALATPKTVVIARLSAPCGIEKEQR